MEIGAFLRRYPPFSDLSDDRLSRLARSVEIAHFAEGTLILRQGGPPADALHVIRKGVVELLDDGEPLDRLGEGEVFGQFSLLAHDRPTVTVRAVEDTLCYLLAGPLATEVLETDAGRSFLSSMLRRRLRAVAAHGRVEPGDPRFRPVRDLVRRPLVAADPGMTVAEAAARMTEERVSCLLVPMRGGWGIVTDHDLRTRVVAVRADTSIPVDDVATFPVRTVRADALVGDALTEMLARSVHHLPVVDGGGAIGVVTDTDLMGIGRHTPFAAKSAIRRARTVDDVARAGRDLPMLVASLVEASGDPVDVGRVIALVTDALTERLVELSLAELGDPPCAFAWLTLGSAARHEQTLTSPQSHAIVYDGGCDAQDFFGALAERVVSGLEAAGVPRSADHPTADLPAMRAPLDRWTATMGGWIDDPPEGDGIEPTAVFDVRRQAGALDAEARIDAIAGRARGDATFLRHLRRRALALEPPTGFVGDLVVERPGEHAGRLDVGRGGISIVVDLARVWALAAGSTAKDTLARLEAAAAAGVLDPTGAWELADAFRFLWDVRLRHHAEQVRAGAALDDAIDPAGLSAVTRSGVKEAFRVIRASQRRLASEPDAEER